MCLRDQVLPLLRDRVADIIIGAVFVFIGLAVCGIAAMRRRSGVRTLVWLGIWSAMWGVSPLIDSLAALGLLPHWFQASVPYLNVVISYMMLFVALLAFLDLTLGKVRIFLQTAILAGLAIALAGIGFFVSAGSNNKLLPYNNLLAACTLAVLVTVVAIPRLSRKFLVLPNRGVLAVGTLVFAMDALYANLARPLGYQTSFIWDSLAFAALLFSLGYVAIQIIFSSESRLLSIEKELEIAREIQSSILPYSVPELKSLRSHAAYRPMTAVAGDFYEFIPIDQNRVGVLMADVTGHGVPAALIASMIKVAVQSVVPCAHDPREVLHGLDRLLSGQLHGLFVSAAYLWLDTENRIARYSAAGHPPLLRYRQGKMERIVSNGMPIGVIAGSDYPVCDIPIKPGDRFLLYTDGLTEPENANGESFGDRRLEQVLGNCRSRSPAELSEQLLSEIVRWQPTSSTQQDDITLIVVDVV